MLISKIYVSIVVPVYNGAQTLQTLIEEIIKVCQKRQFHFEIILTDDCSKDNSWEVLKGLKQKYSFVRIYRLAKNYGQFAATHCGLKHAKGEIVITIDDDLQFPPQEIERMIEYFYENQYLLVYGMPVKLKRNIPRNFLSWLNSKIVRIFIKYRHTYVYSGFRIFGRKILNTILSMPIYQLDFDTQLSWYLSPAHVGFLGVKHEKRNFGKSGYNFTRFLEIEINFFMTVLNSPLKWATYSGSFIMLAVIVILLPFLQGKSNFMNPYNFNPYFLLTLIFCSGLILVALGITGLYLAKIFLFLKGKFNYIVIEGDEELH